MEEEVKEDKKQDNIAEGCAGCGCAIVLIVILFNIVSWAWGIHPIFGILLLLFILGIR